MYHFDVRFLGLYYTDVVNQSTLIFVDRKPDNCEYIEYQDDILLSAIRFFTGHPLLTKVSRFLKSWMIIKTRQIGGRSAFISILKIEE